MQGAMARRRWQRCGHALSEELGIAAFASAAEQEQDVVDWKRT
jgi:hypothetical protein